MDPELPVESEDRSFGGPCDGRLYGVDIIEGIDGDPVAGVAAVDMDSLRTRDPPAGRGDSLDAPRADRLGPQQGAAAHPETMWGVSL